MSECVGCGYCCLKTPCVAAVRLYGSGITECPKLVWNETAQRYFCDLMLIPGPVGDGYREELYAGAGCCCGLNSWRKDIRKRTGKKSDHINPLPLLMQKFIGCMAKEYISDNTVYFVISRLRESLKDDNYSIDEINAITQNIVRIFQENRGSFTKEFMG